MMGGSRCCARLTLGAFPAALHGHLAATTLPYHSVPSAMSL